MNNSHQAALCSLIFHFFKIFYHENKAHLYYFYFNFY